MKTLRRSCKLCFWLLLFFSILFFVLHEASASKPNPQTAQKAALEYQGSELHTAFQLLSGPGEADVLCGKLPPSLSANDSLCFFTKGQNVKVFLGTQCLYAPEMQSYPGNAVGCLHLLPLSAGDGEKTLRIQLTNCFARFPNTFEGVYVGSTEECLQALWSDWFPSILISFLTVLISVIAIVLSFYYPSSQNVSKSIRYEGLLLLSLALWSLAQIPVMYLFPIGSVLLSLEQLSLLFSPVFLVKVVSSLEHPIKFHGEYMGFYVFYTLYAIIAMAAHCLRLAELPVLSIWNILFLAIFLVYTGVFGILESSSEAVFSSSQKVLDSSLLFSAVLDISLLICTAVYYATLSHRRVLVLLSVLLLLCITVLTLWEMRVLLRLQDELAQSHMTLLLSQIKPHFLYNTLNSIRTLIRTDPVSADSLVYNFSRFLRNNMQSINADGLIPFTQELEHITSYVKIEETCFPKLKVVFDIRVRNFFVPPLTIQPLVENAIKHGALKRAVGGCVTISTWENKDSFCIEVCDDGVGFDLEQVLPSSSGHGLQNIIVRLWQLCGATLQIDTQVGHGCMALVKIPKKRGRNAV